MPLPQLLSIVESLGEFRELLAEMPSPSTRKELGGLHGSSDAVVIAALSEYVPQRFFVVVNDDVAGAERWLADLHTLLADDAVALYPPREGFGEAEPHMEVAGERVETLERLDARRAARAPHDARARCSRARACRARSQRAARRAAQGRRRAGSSELAAHLESIGFERVPMVEDVAQFSMRGGIFDVYSFGMAEPVRLEFWGDEIVELRHFDLATQRSSAPSISRSCCRSTARSREDATRGSSARSISSLFPPDTLLVVPRGAHLEPELRRTWDEAQHHIDLARRRGEDVPIARRAVRVAARSRSPRSPRSARCARRSDGGRSADVVFPLRPPETIDRDIKRLRRLVRDGMPTIILCDNEGQAERLDELLNDDSREPSPAALVDRRARRRIRHSAARARRAGLRVLTDHEIFRRERRIRRARRYVTATALDTIAALKPGDYVVHLEHGVGIYRGIETIFVGESTIEVAVVEYEGGDRLNVPLYRIDQLERYRSADDVSDDAPPPRLHQLGGKRWAQQRDKTRAAIQEMTRRAARSLRAPQGRDASAARARHAVAAPARVGVPLRGHARPAHGDDAR